MNKFKWVWLEERNFGALVNATWSKANKIFSFLQVFFLLSWRKTPSLMPSLHFSSACPSSKKKCDLRIKEKDLNEWDSHFLFKRPNFELGFEERIRHQTCLTCGFRDEPWIKNLFLLITKIYFTVSGPPHDQFKSFQKKSLFRKSFGWRMKFTCSMRKWNLLLWSATESFLFLSISWKLQT